MVTKEERADILIIGGGIAGLWCALHCPRDYRTVVLVKGDSRECNTYRAQGGIAAALCPRDSVEKHFYDTITAGKGLCNPEAVRILVEEGPAEVQSLWRLGVPFDQEDGRLALAREGAHSERRVAHAYGDATGQATMEVLLTACREAGVEIREHRIVYQLTVEEGECRGAIALGPDGVEIWSSQVTVLATGGIGSLYSVTTNSPLATGDGLALAFLAGAELVDLEFVQFHPTALAAGTGPVLLISEAVRGEGAVLINSQGHRFLSEYHPLAELAPRDVVARAIFMEMMRTGSSRVFLDISHRGEEFVRKRFPNIFQGCYERGFNLGREPVPVAPAAHYHMGGIRTDLWGRTSVARLYACGECAGTGVHGANRLASNSLTEGLVFGRRVASVLAEWLDQPFPSSVRQIPPPPLPLSVDEVARMQRIMTRFVGVTRKGEGLEEAKRYFEDRAEHLKGANFFPLLVCWLVAAAALWRTESRGSHFRDDFPDTDDGNWRRRQVWKSCGDLPWKKAPLMSLVPVASGLVPIGQGGGSR